MDEYRLEKDYLGEVKIPMGKLWGAQTQRSLQNFKIGPEQSMPLEVIEAYGYIKKASALANSKLGLLNQVKKDLIVSVCDEIIAGELRHHFPLVIWQTGSGTHTNMNCNEVISNRAQILSGRSLNSSLKIIHPNDDANLSQSSNDTFSTAMQIAAYKSTDQKLLPALNELHQVLVEKSIEFWDIVKVGRTHMMDAVPIRLGQEFSGYSAQLNMGIEAINDALLPLAELPLGGTAVGTGLNTLYGFDSEVCTTLEHLTGFPFKPARNKFALIASHDTILRLHNAIKQVAVGLLKMSNDLRMMVSGPKSGLAELNIEANEAGSSIMPGKVNPTQIEALSMVCVQVMGNDSTITIANSQGHFELNVFKPVIIANLLESVNLLSEACISFTHNCLSGIKPDEKRISELLEHSLMMITALNPFIGYEKSGMIARKALIEGKTLRAAAIELGFVGAKDYDLWVVPTNMTMPKK